jgi:excisionase family DNA binding protein
MTFLPKDFQQANAARVSPLFENQLLDYEQAAQYLSISVAYLRKLKSKGKIPFVALSERCIRFKVNSLNQWIERREIK